MSGQGQSRHFGRRPTTSGLPLETNIVRAGRHVSKGATRLADLRRAAAIGGHSLDTATGYFDTAFCFLATDLLFSLSCCLSRKVCIVISGGPFKRNGRRL